MLVCVVWVGTSSDTSWEGGVPDRSMRHSSSVRGGGRVRWP